MDIGIRFHSFRTENLHQRKADFTNLPKLLKVSMIEDILHSEWESLKSFDGSLIIRYAVGIRAPTSSELKKG